MQSSIVVGGGILGASTAYHLAKAGAQVTLIDRKDRCQATDAAAGIICPWLSQRRNQAWYRLAKNGARYYPALIRELEADGEGNTGYSRVGALCVHTDEKKLDQIEERAYKRRQDAPEIGVITRLSPPETKALFPLLADHYGAVHVSGGARVNGKELRHSLIHAARNYGASIRQGEASVMAEGNRVTGIKLGEERLVADQVIVTAGAWANELLQPLGVHFLVKPQKAQIVHLEVPDTDIETGKWPVIMPPNKQYILAFAKGRIVVGATHEDEAGYDQRVTAGGLYEILDKALQVAPGLVPSTMVETRVGFRPFTPGFLPVLGLIPNYAGLLVANGLGASGLTVGPYLGAQLAGLALGRSTEIDIRDYDVATALQRPTS